MARCQLAHRHARQAGIAQPATRANGESHQRIPPGARNGRSARDSDTRFCKWQQSPINHHARFRPTSQPNSTTHSNTTKCAAIRCDQERQPIQFIGCHRQAEQRDPAHSKSQPRASAGEHALATVAYFCLGFYAVQQSINDEFRQL